MIKQTLFLLIGCLLLIACSSQTPDNLPEVILATPVQGQAGISSGQSAVSTNGNVTILDVLADNGEFALFLNMLNNAGLADELVNGDNMTIFAPTNLVFSQIGLSRRLDPNDVWLIMRHHIVDEVLTTADLRTRTTLISNEGSPINVTIEEDELLLDYARVLDSDMAAGNGVVHMIDALLLPPEQGEAKSMWGVLVEDGRFTQLIDYAGGLPIMYALRFGSIMNGFLAPTDTAFAQSDSALADLLNQNRVNLEFLFNYYTIAPDGWPDGEPLTAAAMLELGEVKTLVIGAGFGSFVQLPVTGEGEIIKIGEAIIIEEIETETGVTYVLDRVLLPDALAEHLD